MNIITIVTILSNLNFVVFSTRPEMLVTETPILTYHARMPHQRASTFSKSEAYEYGNSLTGDTTEIPSLNCTKTVVGNMGEHKIYKYISGFAAIISFAIGLYLRPDLMRLWFKRFILKQYTGYVADENVDNELRIRNQLQDTEKCDP